MRLVEAHRDVTSKATRAGKTPAGLTGHEVQFYGSEPFLVQSVVDFLASGLRAGQPLVVIATEPHRHAFSAALRAQGLDTEAYLGSHEAVWLDARETLAAFMEGARPNAELFKATVGRVFEKVLNKRSYLVVRGYGEMVNLLWKDGNDEGAIQLERLWNELATKYAFSLLCGYALDGFLKDSGVERFRRVCGEHSHALPLERELEAG
jgi:hypothetical protein